MSCESMLLQLLEAEPEELRRSADTPLTRHLAECPRCAALADRLIADTAHLAFAVRADAAIAANSIRRRSRWWLLPVAATAVLALMLLRERTPPAAVPTPVSAAVVPTSTVVVRPPVAAMDAPRAVIATASRRRMPAAQPVRVQPMPQLVAYHVEPLVVEPEPAPTPLRIRPAVADRRGRVIDARGAVIVEPPPSKRAIILRSAVPGVTVIWLN